MSSIGVTVVFSASGVSDWEQRRNGFARHLIHSAWEERWEGGRRRRKPAPSMLELSVLLPSVFSSVIGSPFLCGAHHVEVSSGTLAGRLPRESPLASGALRGDSNRATTGSRRVPPVGTSAVSDPHGGVLHQGALGEVRSSPSGDGAGRAKRRQVAASPPGRADSAAPLRGRRR